MDLEDKANYFRVPITMPADMVEFLEKMGMRSKRTGGKKIPNTMIVRSAVRVLGKLDLNVDGVQTEEELDERILDACRRYKYASSK